MSALRLLLLLLLPLCPGPGPGHGSEAKVVRSCAETRQVLGTRGYSLNLIPPSLISGEHLQICPQEYTCCSSETEQKLIRDAEVTFRGLVEDSGSFLIHTLAARHRKFNEFFREMLSLSQHSLAQLFSHSYGRLYSQHAVVFNNLFSGLRDYYEKSGEGLDDALADFWAQLLERAFPLLHPQYSFPPDFLLCLTRITSTADGSLQPFGDSPRRLRLQITRALVAARALVQGLETGRNVVSETLKVPVLEGCKQALMRLIGCPLCRGVPSLMPCRGFCLNVAHGCLSSRGLEPEWGGYLDGLLLLAEKLQGPFSFELAAESIGVKISEGLMHLQENSVKVSAKCFRNVGPPIRCSPVTGEHQRPEKRLAGRGGHRPRKNGPRQQRALICTVWFVAEPVLVWELRERLSRVRGFWAGLPVTVCGDTRMAADVSQEAAPCWTGVGRGRYMSPVVVGSLNEQLHNPELDPASPDVPTRRRRLHLRAATARMKAAALGQDLDMHDADEDASGSGAGQQYADDWKAGAAPVVPPARPPRPPRPPRRDGLGVRGGSGSARYNQGRSRNPGASVVLHSPRALVLLPAALTLLGLR
ncbi:Glypican-2 [Apodemus speciosus]|uniref:Glypican-2 n=1 Tax=Apodemus speciosus TaxID=105296 RepID=A0ABQ0ETM4_APOSI